jgi:hypothetical protein
MKLKLKGKGWFYLFIKSLNGEFCIQNKKQTGKRTNFNIAPFFGVFNKKIKVTKSGYHTPPPR